MFEQLFSIVTPVYLCIAVGFVWQRIGRPVDNGLIADLCMNLGAPCLVFSSLVAIEVDPTALGELICAVFAAFVCFGLLGWGVLRAAGVKQVSMLATLVFPNTGNLGLPICLFAYGQEGLVYAVVFFALTSLVQFSVGQWLWSGQVSLSQLARTPLVYAVLSAAVVLALDLPVPEWLMRTTETIGGITIPLMQFTLGVSLATLQVSRWNRSIAIGSLRLAMGFGVGVLLCELFALEGLVRGVVILDCAMPTAVINYLFAERYGREPADVAGVVVASTTLSLVSLPLILVWLL